MLRLAAVSLILAIVAADDPFAKFGWSRRDVVERAWSTLAEGPDETFDLAYGRAEGSALKQVPPEARVAATRALLGVIKASLGTEEGLRAWKDAAVTSEPPPSPRQVLGDEQQRLQGWKEDLEELAPSMSPEQIQERKDFIARLQKSIADRERSLATDEAAYREQLARWKARAKDPAAEQKRELRAFLGLFLSETEKLPWDAKLVANEKGRQVFADAKLEKKPLWWKACFRAGREPTDAAREFAKSWLAELGGPLK